MFKDMMPLTFKPKTLLASMADGYSIINIPFY